MNAINILMGPKLGDMIHSLTVPAFIWQVFGMKTNFYIFEKYDTFTTSLERTYQELIPILSNQEYINDFQIYDENKHEIHIDLNQFRFNGLLYTRSFWAVFLHTVFKDYPIIPRNFVALDVSPDYTFKDCLLIHRKWDRFSDEQFIQKCYNNVMKKFDKIFFIDFRKHNYEKFFFNDKCELLEVTDLLKYLQYLKGCKTFITNISGPLCMATSLSSPRIGEILEFNIPHYANDHLFFDDVEFFSDKEIFTPNPKYLVD